MTCYTAKLVKKKKSGHQKTKTCQTKAILGEAAKEFNINRPEELCYLMHKAE